MNDLIKECVKWLRNGQFYSPCQEDYWADAIETLQVERDALAAQVKGEKLWEERCADLEAQIVAMIDACEYLGHILPMAKQFSHEHDVGSNRTIVSLAEDALRKWREAEGK